MILQLYWHAGVLGGVLAALLLLLLFSRRYHLPPGPPGNVAGEFKNATMPKVFEKWRRKYGA